MEYKKPLYFILLALWLLGLVGGVGYTLYCGAYPIAIGVAVNGYLSFDKVKEMFDYIKL